jgi:hypothetical protein
LLAHACGAITDTPDRSYSFTQSRLLAVLCIHSGLDCCLHLYLSGYWVRQLNVNVDNIWNEMTGLTQLTCLAIGGQVII